MRSPLIRPCAARRSDPDEDLVVDFERKAASGAAQPRVIRHSLALRQTQELSQRKAVRAAPFQNTPAVRLQNNGSAACESSGLAATMGGRDAVHIPSRIASQRTRRSPPRSAQLAACRRTRVPESVASPPTRPACPPAVPVASKRHSPPAFLVGWPANQTTADFVNGLLGPVRRPVITTSPRRSDDLRQTAR
jgi:hypothetical protein